MSDEPTNGVPENTEEWEEKIQKEKAEQANQEEAKPSPEIQITEEQEAKPEEESSTDPIITEDDLVKALDAKYDLSQSNRPTAALAEVINSILGDKLTREQRAEILRDRDHYVSRLLQTDNNPGTTSQAVFSTLAMGESEDPSSLKTSDKDKVSKGKKNYKSELTGRAAANAFTARVKGIKKVYLYNSGFYICLRPMELSELDDFYMSVDQDGEELGRVIGGLMFLIHDVHLKSKFMELLSTIVVDSNLVGFNKKNALANNISIQDLDTLYWAVCSMMHKNGIKIDLVCGYEDCKHITSNQLLDVNKMRIVDTSGMNNQALKVLLSDEPMTIEQAKEYREDLLDLNDKFDYNQIRFDLHVPTIGEVIKYNRELMSIIVNTAGGETSIENVKLIRSVMVNYNKNFAPWISKVTYIDEDGQPEFSSRDRDAVNKVLALNDESEDEGVIVTEVSDFMKKTKMSHVGYAVIKCEGCGKSSTDHINGYKAWDAQALFTSLTSLKLGQIGMG